MRVAGIVLASIAVVFATASCGATIVPVRNSAPGAPVVASSGASLRDGGELWRNDIPPRYQWNHNYGYCGEVSMISAGLYYGQYISQYDARAAASNAPQNEYRSQLLLGVNDLRAAERMRLAAVRWDVPSRKDSKQFLAWVKVHVLRGEPVAIGIYMNQFRFYGNRNPWAGSPQYDHIVPVVGMGGDDITFSDNGEWGSLRDARYFFTYRIADFPRTRRQANEPRAPIYSLASDAHDFAIAITGVVDRDRETLPVRVATNLNYELPQIVEGSSRRPRPEPLALTVTVSGMQPNTVYHLYRYNRLDAIPDGRFNAHAADAQQEWDITAGGSGRFVMTQKIMSDEVAAYRAVPANAP